MPENDSDRDPLGKALGLVPIETPTQVDVMYEVATDDSATADFEKARAAIITVMEESALLASRACEVADASQSAASFEAAAGLLKTQLSAARDLLTLQRDIRAIKHADNRVSRPQNVTNQVLIATTTELLDKIEDMRNNQDDG